PFHLSASRTSRLSDSWGNLPVPADPFHLSASRTSRLSDAWGNLPAPADPFHLSASRTSRYAARPATGPAAGFSATLPRSPLGRCVAHEVGQEPLDDPVLADDLLGPLAPGRGQDRLLVLAALDEPLGLEPLQHLARGRPRDPEHFCHAGRQRGRAGGLRPVLADREGEEVDRLEVLVDGVSLRHAASLRGAPRAACKVS